MQSYSYETQGVCAKLIAFSIDEENKLHDVKFFGGCPGNTAAISKLIEGEEAGKISEILIGNDCGGRGTSCADQLATAIKEVLAKEKLETEQM